MVEQDDNHVYLNIVELINHEVEGSDWVDEGKKYMSAILNKLKEATGKNFSEISEDWVMWYIKSEDYDLESRSSIKKMWEFYKKEIEFVAKIEKLKKKNK